jgi:hypothetical protein
MFQWLVFTHKLSYDSLECISVLLELNKSNSRTTIYVFYEAELNSSFHVDLEFVRYTFGYNHSITEKFGYVSLHRQKYHILTTLANPHKEFYFDH